MHHDGVVTTEAGASSHADGVLAPHRRALTLGLVLAITLVGFEALAISTVLPDIKDDLHGVGLYGWVFSAFFLGTIVGIVFAGHSADRHGPARPFAAGLVLFGAGLLAGGFAPSMGALVVARAVQGLGAGAIPAVVYVAIGRAFPAALQPRMFALLSTAWVVPSVAGPALSAAVSHVFGWRWVLLGLLPLVAANGVLTTPALRKLGPPGGAGSEDTRLPALALAAGAGLVLAGASARSVVLAIPLLVTGAVIGARAFMRLMPTGTLQLRRGLPAAVALRGSIAFAFFGVDAFVTLTLTDVRHTSVGLGGVALTAAALAWTGGAWVQERRVARIGPRRFVRVGALAITAGIGGMIVTAQVAVPIVCAVLSWAVVGFGMGLAYAPTSLIVLGEAPAGKEGAASAALNLSETLGVALGTGTSGAVVAVGDTLEWSLGATLTIAFVICAVIAVLTSAGSVRLPRVVAAGT